MSYLVLARKYRPRNFAELVGQNHVVQALTNALTTQRLHHAYLFTGTRGVGKTTISRILAKSLNCQGPDGNGTITAAPCGVCSACRDIDAGRFVDYTELDAASNRSVDEVQALLEQAVYKPVQGRFKVFMIDEVHMLTGHAFNAMLKTLEEPPAYLKFVLATTDPQKVPVTVLSRCLQFNLRPMAPETICEQLQKVLQLEAVPADAASLQLLARAARGSMRDALSLTDQAISFGAGQLQQASVRQMLGSVDGSYVFGLLEALAQGNGKAVVETCEALRLQGLSAVTALEEMSRILQRMAVLQALAQAAPAALDSDPELAAVQRLAALLPADETQLLYSICLHGLSELGLAPDEYAGLTMVLLRLLAFKPPVRLMVEKKTLPDALTPPAPIAAAAPTRAVVAPAPSATLPLHSGQRLNVVDGSAVRATASALRQPASVAPMLPVPVSASDEMIAMPVRQQSQPLTERSSGRSPPVLIPSEDGEFWQRTVQQLIDAEAVSAMVRELALQSQLVGRDEDQWLLRVESESLNHGGHGEKLAAALRANGCDVRIAVEVGRVTDSPALRNAAQAAQRQLLGEKVIFEHPVVQHLMHDFAAKIIPGSIKFENRR